MKVTAFFSRFREKDFQNAIDDITIKQSGVQEGVWCYENYR